MNPAVFDAATTLIMQVDATPVPATTDDAITDAWLDAQMHKKARIQLLAERTPTVQELFAGLQATRATKRARLLDLDRLLAAAIARIEPKRPKHPTKRYEALLEQPRILTMAMARYLVWHSYLNRMPSQESVTHAFHVIRGQMLWRMARLAIAQGQPIQQEIPAFARAAPFVAERADTPNDGGDPNGDTANDPASWWDTFAEAVFVANIAQDTELYQSALDGLTDDEKAAIIDAAGGVLAIGQWLDNALAPDSQVAQVLDSYWNGATITTAGQQFLDEGGIAGDFNLVDANMMQFLQQYAGQLVTKIDATTRAQLANSLWTGLGGAGGPPLAMESLARYLQNDMSQLSNALAGMSLQRARMIAITETARAESVGGLLSMLSTGVQQKVWLITVGACIICEGNQGQGAIGILDEFPSGDQAPPAHPMCRCSCAPALTTDTGYATPDLSWNPDPDAIAALFDDPSFGLFPDYSLDSLRAATPDEADVATLRQRLGDAVMSAPIEGLIQFISSQLSSHATIEDMLDVLNQHPARMATAERDILSRLRHALHSLHPEQRMQEADAPLYAACVAALQGQGVAGADAERMVLASWDLLSDEWNGSTTI